MTPVTTPKTETPDGDWFTRQLLTNISNENDPEYDEDAAVCDCGHTFREHCGRAFAYACAKSPCGCVTFRARPEPSDVR